MFQFLVLIYLIIYIAVFFAVSKKNGSYFNSYTVGMAYIFVMQGVFLFVSSLDGKLETQFSFETLATLAFSLIIGIVLQYAGYCVGFKRPLNVKFIQKDFSQKTVKKISVFALAVAIIGFLLLGYFGVGITAWIFDTRTAYIGGRSGNGLWYVMFLFFLMIAFVTVLFLAVRFKKKRWILLLFLLAFSLLSGSKSFTLGLIVFALFCYDRFYKKIKLGQILLIGVVGFIGINIFLTVQSDMTILDYVKGDFYYNYLRLIDGVQSGAINHSWGGIWAEDVFYSLLPRNIFSDKPLIYGTSRLPAYFYGEASVIAGNTPSFSQYGVGYADFGLVGVGIFAFIQGFIQGLAEGTLRKQLVKKGSTLFCLVLYCAFFFVGLPINYVLLFLLIYVLYLLAGRDTRGKVLLTRYNAYGEIKYDT